MTATLSPEQLETLMADKAITILDVRRRADYEAVQHTIPGAVWHDPEQVETWAAELPAGKPVAIYCARGGSVSKSVHMALTEKGIDAKYLEGGLAAWDAAKTPGDPA